MLARSGRRGMGGLFSRLTETLGIVSVSVSVGTLRFFLRRNRIVKVRAIIKTIMMIMGAMSFRTRVDDDEESSDLVIEGEPNGQNVIISCESKELHDMGVGVQFEE